MEIVLEFGYTTGPFLCGPIISSVRVGKTFLFPQCSSPLSSGDQGIITPTRFFLTCLYILFQLVAMQIDLPLYLNSITRAVFLVLVKFSRLEDFHSSVSQNVVIERRLFQDALH